MPNRTGREAVPTETPCAAAAEATVKCLVWDLDNTIWKGVLLEDERVRLRPGIRAVLETLDRRGILHSLASRNEVEPVMAKLGALDLTRYFLHPQIGWMAKAVSIQTIAERLNIGLDAVAFIDDDPFERDSVRSALPQVRVFDAREAARLPELPAFSPRFTTEDARRRREMMQGDIERNQAEQEFGGPREEFLAGLGMRFTLGSAGAGDLARAEELTVRTHQLNSTGYTYSCDELERLRSSPEHWLLMAELEDRYGSYGKIGLALVAREERLWTIRLLLMSCRVMSRGVGTILLQHILAAALRAGARLQAEFIPTKVNRQMYVTFRFAGFAEVGRRGAALLLEADFSQMPAVPPYIDVIAGP
ncbi:MAG: HAD-IIIC family phosphatase [Candidatus Eisenbacteria bacterium]